MAVVVLLSTAALNASSAPAAEIALLATHPPILISGNLEFTPANGVVAGSGTDSDPYLIEDFEINASSGHGIEIRNTDANFVIRNVAVHSGAYYTVTDGYIGIYLRNVSNGRIENVTATGNTEGIRVDSGSSISLVDNFIHSNIWHGMVVTETTDLLVVGNRESDWLGILVTLSSNVTVTRNTASIVSLGTADDILVSSNTLGGLESFGWAHNVTMSDNTLTGAGIRVSTTANIRIANNSMVSNGRGIVLDASENVSIDGNSISSSFEGGILLRGSANVTMHSNVLTNDGLLIEGALPPHFRHNITEDNLVNGLPLFYRRDCSDLVLDGVSVGQVVIANCTKVEITNSTIGPTNAAVELAFVEYATVAGNTLANSRWGIYVTASADVAMSRNEISGDKVGILCSGCARVTVDENNVSQNGRPIREGAGVALLDTSDAVVVNNSIDRTLGTGLTIRAGRNIVAANNLVSYNTEGIAVFDSLSNVTVHHNVIVRNGNQAWSFGPGNAWDDGYPSGGNYWSDFLGMDVCRGREQADCTAPDGLGDSPYLVRYGGTDRYPLYSRPGSAGDTVPPEVFISAPSEGAVFADETVTVRGSASDTGGSDLARVAVRVNNGSWGLAEGASLWTAEVELKMGTNFIEARAWDQASNPSSVVSVNVTLKARVISVAVVTEKHDYAPGDRIDIAVIVTNIGTAPFNLTFFSCEASFEVQDYSGKTLYVPSLSCPLWVYKLRLEPGQNETNVFSWDQVDLSEDQVTYPECYTIRGFILSAEPTPVGSTSIRIGEPPINVPPHAGFEVSPGQGTAGTAFAFNGSASTDCEDPPSALESRWDWESDGLWDTPWSQDPLASHVYWTPATYTARLEIRDTEGASRIAERSIVVAPDVDPPRITHVPESAAIVGEKIPVLAFAEDNGGIRSVFLHYRGVEDEEFHNVLMTSDGGNSFSADIPAQNASGTLVYFITAEDMAGNQGRAPSTGDFVVAVSGPPSHPVSEGDFWTWVTVGFLVSGATAPAVYLVARKIRSRSRSR